jgi:hypothetical protein
MPMCKNEEPRLGPAGAGFWIRLSLSDLVESEPLSLSPYRCQLQTQYLTDIDDANGGYEKHGRK